MTENIYNNNVEQPANYVPFQANGNAGTINQPVNQSFTFNVIASDEDRALLAFVDTKKQILENLVFNLEHYKKNDWDRSSCMKKMFNEDKKIISLRSGSKTVITLGYQPTECYSNEQKIACLTQLGQSLIKGTYDKHIKDNLIKEYLDRKEKSTQRQRIAKPISPIPPKMISTPPVNDANVIKTPVREPKPSTPYIPEPDWNRMFNFQ